MKHKTYTGLVKSLKDNQIFVFGSNTEGRHGAGAAKFARDYCGARYGQASGLQGRSYGIITKDLTQNIHPSISKDSIILQIQRLYQFAEDHQELEFLIAYSATGANLNGYTSFEMAEMFNQKHIPKNIVFEEQFYQFIKILNPK